MKIVTDLSDLSDSAVVWQTRQTAHRIYFCKQFSTNAPLAWEALLELEPLALAVIEQAGMDKRLSEHLEYLQGDGKVAQKLRLAVAGWAKALRLRTDSGWLENVCTITLLRQAMSSITGISRPASISAHQELDDQSFTLIAPVQINVPTPTLVWHRESTTWAEFRSGALREFESLLETIVTEKLGKDLDAITPKKQFRETDAQGVDWFTRHRVGRESIRSLAKEFSGDSRDHRKTVSDRMKAVPKYLGLVVQD